MKNIIFLFLLLPVFCFAQLAPSNGGTGLTSYTIGDIIYANGTSSLARLANVATGNVILSGGVGTASAWGKVGLTTHVSGNLPVTNLNAGTSASASTFWRGDGTWATPASGADNLGNHTATQALNLNGQNVTSGNLATFDTVTVTTSAYASGWNGDNTVPTKDAVYDKIETLDPSATNEGALSVGAATTTSSQIASNTSGDGGVILKVLTTGLISESVDTIAWNIGGASWTATGVIANVTRTDTLLNGSVVYGHFERTGNIVDFSVRWEVGLGADTTGNVVYVPLPYASNFTQPSVDVLGDASVNAQGVYGGNPIKVERCLVFADDTSDRIAVAFTVDKQGATYPANRVYITATGHYSIQ